MAQVLLDTVVKKFGKTQVIHGVSSHFRDGEFIVIVGPSGCGKSTVLRMIAGLEEVSSGTISIGDTVVNDIEPKDRKIAMVFQNYALYPHMTVFNNMAYGLKLQKLGRTEIKERVGEAAEMLQLGEYLKRKPRQLSGGQRQRVAMGRALVRKPSVFLFDEPLSNLDAKLRQQMRVELKKIHKKLGTTMIYVTHDQVEAMTLADKIVVMNEGRIEQIGSPDEIYFNPATKFVASFIGSPPMNFLTGTLTQPDIIELQDQTEIVLPKALNSPNKKIILGIRPEDIKLILENTSSSIQLDINFTEKLGAGELIYSAIDEEELILSLHNGFKLKDKKCLAEFPQDKLYFFDPVSGKRV